MVNVINHLSAHNLHKGSEVVHSRATLTGAPGVDHLGDGDSHLFVPPAAPLLPERSAASGLFFCVCFERLDLEIGEQQLGWKLRDLSAKERHEHDSPGDHQIDGNGSF